MPFPALLAASLALPFAGRIVRTVGGFVRRRPVATTAAVGGVGLAAFGAQQALTMGGNGDATGGFAPRRRRKRALTADDMRTMLTIASAVSKKAAENFILQRTRR